VFENCIALTKIRLRLMVALSLTFCPLLANIKAQNLLPFSDSLPSARQLIVWESDVRTAADKAGFKKGNVVFVTYRLVLDTGEVFSLVPPERIGVDAVRILKLEASGEILADTLALERIRTIGSPDKGVDLPGAFAGAYLAVALPIAFSGGNPLPMFTQVFAWGIPFSRLMEFQSLSAQDYFTPSRRYSSTIAVTFSSLPRTVVDSYDPRREISPAWKLNAETGSVISPVTFGLGLRIVTLGKTWTKESPVFPNGNSDINYQRQDSLYADKKFGSLFSTSLSFIWAENPQGRVFTSIGAFWLLNSLDGREANKGVDIGAGFDVRLTPNWALRSEGTMLMPLNTSWDATLEPSLGLGIAYQYNPRPKASFQLPITVSLLDQVPARKFSPEILMEAEEGKYQSIGMGAAYSSLGNRVWQSSQQPPTEFSRGSSYLQQGSQQRLDLLFTYGIHTDRKWKAYAGVQMQLGMSQYRTNEGIIQSYDTSVYIRSTVTRNASMLIGLVPEAGLRLPYGFGLRFQWLALQSVTELKPNSPAYTAGITYTIPGFGERQ
jgi:hypothetical protein